MKTFTQRLENYTPYDEKEGVALKELVSQWQNGETLFSRKTNPHLTASAFTVDADFTHTLFIRHGIFRAYGFPGGHADGEREPLYRAAAELTEETGVRGLPYVSVPISIDDLPVCAHTRQGVSVAAHRHLNVTFLFVADRKSPPTPEPDGDAVWVPLDSLESVVTEPHMLAVYRKCVLRASALRETKAAISSSLARLLVPWYETNKRDLPWRRTRDPYRIWLSEIMLQQTRVQAVCGYYERFTRALPDVKALAECPDDTLMKLWEGLGYYSRARNLKRAAQTIVRERNGVFPDTAEALRKLPGIGAYTAGAVASIAFGRPSAAVDGNVLRVAGRALECFSDAEDPRWRKRLTSILEAVYPAEKAAEFTQSFMDLGASVCLPERPRCSSCPLGELCLARRNRTEDILPAHAEKKPRKTQRKTVFVLKYNDRVAVRKRDGNGLLAGMWEFPHLDGHCTEREASQYLASVGLRAEGAFTVTTETHVFTHLVWEMLVYTVPCAADCPAFVWTDPNAEDSDISLPTAFRKCLS